MANLSALILVILNVSQAQAQDVYNFYFQKSQNAKEMVQVKNGSPLEASKTSLQQNPLEAPISTPAAEGLTAASSSIATPSAPTSAGVSTAVVPAQEVARDYSAKYWRVMISKALFGDGRVMVFDGIGARVEYGFNRYLSLEGNLLGGKAQYVRRQYYGYNGYSSNDSDSAGTYFAGSVGGRVTPIHLNVFGWDLLKISATAGLLTSNQWVASAGGSDSRQDSKLAIVPYYGVDLGLNITQRLSVGMDFKTEFASSENYGQVTAGVGYKF